MISPKENLPLFSLPKVENSEYKISSPKEFFETNWEGIVAGFIGKTEAIVMRTL